LLGLLLSIPSLAAPPPEDLRQDPTQVAQEVFQGPEFWWKRTERVEYSPSGLAWLLKAIVDILGEILARLWDWLIRLLLGLLKMVTGDWSGGTPLVWLATVAVLAWASWKLARHLAQRRRRASGEADRTQPADYQQLPEADVLFQQAGEALRAGGYAETVRLALLALIAHLQQRGLLRYDPARTNREYQSELRAEAELAHVFGQVALPYERVWYGRLPATPGDAEGALGLCRSVLVEKRAAYE
jgi:hypothetical protein